MTIFRPLSLSFPPLGILWWNYFCSWIGYIVERRNSWGYPSYCSSSKTTNSGGTIYFPSIDSIVTLFTWYGFSVMYFEYLLCLGMWSKAGTLDISTRECSWRNQIDAIAEVLPTIRSIRFDTLQGAFLLSMSISWSCFPWRAHIYLMFIVLLSVSLILMSFLSLGFFCESILRQGKWSFLRGATKWFEELCGIFYLSFRVVLMQQFHTYSSVPCILFLNLHVNSFTYRFLEINCFVSNSSLLLPWVRRRLGIKPANSYTEILTIKWMQWQKREIGKGHVKFRSAKQPNNKKNP